MKRRWLDRRMAVAGRRARWAQAARRRSTAWGIAVLAAGFVTLLYLRNLPLWLAVLVLAVVAREAVSFPPCPRCGGRVRYGKPGRGWRRYITVTAVGLPDPYCQDCDRFLDLEARPRQR